jgi:hypothetical protein
MPKFAFSVSFVVSMSCALAAGALCVAGVEGQERAVVSTGTTMQASVTILPSLDAAEFVSVPFEPQLAANMLARRSTLLVAATRASELTGAPRSLRVDPPVARSFERLDRALRHTIAVLY